MLGAVDFLDRGFFNKRINYLFLSNQGLGLVMNYRAYAKRKVCFINPSAVGNEKNIGRFRGLLFLIWD